MFNKHKVVVGVIALFRCVRPLVPERGRRTKHGWGNGVQRVDKDGRVPVERGSGKRSADGDSDPVARINAERTVGIVRDFEIRLAFKQAHRALLLVHPRFDAAGSVQRNDRAVGQRDLFLVAHARPVDAEAGVFSHLVRFGCRPGELVESDDCGEDDGSRHANACP